MEMETVVRVPYLAVNARVELLGGGEPGYADALEGEVGFERAGEHGDAVAQDVRLELSPQDLANRLRKHAEASRLGQRFNNVRLVEPAPEADHLYSRRGPARNTARRAQCVI